MKLKPYQALRKSPILLAIIMCLSGIARAAFVPVAVTGYNADVVANGVGTATSSTTADVDGAGYAFMAADFNPLGALPTAFMPPSGMVHSVATSGVLFQLAPYTASNSLRLTATNSGTLSFSTAQSASEVYLLGVSGSGGSAATITVTFTDASTQVFTSVAFADWYGGANFAIRGMGRVNTTSNGIDNNPSDPRLYEIKLSLSAANYSKQIATIGVAKTNATGVINIMGVAVNTVSGCSAPSNQPSALLITPGTTTATLAFVAAVPAADKYLVVRTTGAALTTNPSNGTAYTTGTTLGNGTIVGIGVTTSLADAGLSAASTYRYAIFAYNDLCSSGPSYNTTSPLTTTVVTNSATAYVDVPATGYTADVVADTGGSASGSISADVDGAGYAFMAQNYNPSGSIFPTSFLPGNGLINSATTAGLSFQLKPYTGNNSLRLATVSSGTLTLSTPIAASDLYLLATSGSGVATANVTVTFSDATTQVFSAVSISDWYGGANYARLGLGRVAVATNTIDNNTSNPRLYEIKLTISASNYNKQIASVTVAKASTGGVVNVMGLAAVTLAPCATPVSQASSLVLGAGSSSISIAFTAAAPQVNKYMIVRNAGTAALTGTPTDGIIYTVGASLGNGTIVGLGSGNQLSDGAVAANTGYRYTVFAYNDICSGGPLYNTTSPLTGTVSTSTTTTYTWNGSANFTYTNPVNWTPARYVPDASDILQFNNGQINAVYGVPAQTVGRILLSNNTTVMLQSSAAVTLTVASDNVASTDELSIGSGSTLLLNGSALTSSSLTLAFSGSGATVSIAGTLETFGLVTFGGNNFFNCTNASVTVASSGTLSSGGTQTTAAITGNTTANLVVNGTINYKYSSTSNPAMPTATWNTGSTAIVSGFNTPTGGPNGGMNQAFYNFTYDCKSQTSATNWSGTGPLTVSNTFTLSSTGTGSLVFGSTQGYSYQLNNYTQTGGILNLNSGTATATPTLSVSGTFNQSAGTLTSTGTSTGANTPVLHFNGSGSAQNVSFFNAAPVGRITYRLSNANGINLTGTGTLTSAFNLNTNGGIWISTTAANPISTTLVLTYGTGSTLTYDAPGLHTMTANVFPTTNGPSNLTINTGGSANMVTMPFSRSISGILTMLSGDIGLGGNTLTLGSTAAAPGTLSYTAGFIQVGTGGSFVRWFGTSALPTTAGTGVGFYPVGYNGLNRSVAFFFSSATALSTGGSIGVSHTNAAGFTNSLSVSDGAYTIDTRTNSSWSFATATLALSGTIGMQLNGSGLFTSANPANLRPMKASSVAGAHVAGFGNTAQRSGLSLTDLASAHYIGAAAADITGVYTAISTGNWSTGSTWDIGSAPGVANEAFINPGVTVTSNSSTNTAKSLNVLPGGVLNISGTNAVTLDSALQNNGTINVSGGTLTVSGRSNLSGILNNGAGQLNISSGTVNLGPAGGGAIPFQEHGVLNVTGGTLNVNGYFSTISTSAISQSGGNINVDGNAGGVAAASVLCATPIVSLSNAANSFTGGTFTVVDPHACTTGANTFVYNNAANITASGTHVFRMGNGVSTDPGGQTPYNFSVNTSVSSTGKLAFNDLVINTGTTTNSYFVQGSATMGVTRDLIVNAGGEFRNNATSQTTYINNNLTVNSGGTFSGLGTVAFANFSSGTAVASTNAQTVSGAGAFRNVATATPAAKFNSITVNNAGTGVTFNIGNVPYSGALTFTRGNIYMGTSILAQNAGATLSGPAQTTGWVVGKFQKNATAGSLAHSYPVGNTAYYTPLSINGTAATAGDIIVGAVATDHPGLGSSLINPTRSVNRYWSISQANGLTFSAAGATITPNWNAADLDAGVVTTNLIAGRFASAAWTLPTVSSPTATSLVAAIVAANIDGDYAFGETCALPAIAGQPTAQLVCAGSSATFSVTVTNTAGIIYQWQKNGNPIPGATGSVYTIPVTATTDAGSYTVVLSSQCSSLTSVTSAAASLTVNAPVAISSQPTSQAICEHGTVTFSVSATGTGIAYQWLKNGTAITGATSSAFSISNIALGDAGSYTVLISGTSPCGSLSSTAAVLTVNPLPLVITPATTPVFCAGGSVVLNATTGYTYQWQLNGSAISGATSAAYTASSSGNYTVLISNTTTGCNGTSNAINVIANSPPVSTISPAGTAAYCSGGAVTLTGPATGGVTYQWNLGGSPISGATNSTYAANAAGSYTLTVAAGTGCSTTSSATVVSMNNLPAATATAATSATICAGSSVTINANTGTALTYVWNLNGVPVSPAATGASFVASSAGAYTVTVTNTTTGCQNTSAAVTVSVNPLPAAAITAAGAITFCQGDSVTLNANAGTGLSYVWNVGGSPITPAATGASYKVKNAGSYTVKVTNTTTGCQQTSGPTSVTVNALPNVAISASGSLNLCAGSSVTLSVPSVTGLTYQWMQSGTNIPAASNASLSVNTVGSYSVLVGTTATGCAATSATAVVTVNPLPSATVSAAGSTTACQGDTVWLNANTGSSLSYQWRLNGVDVSGATNASFPAVATGSYTVVVTNGSGCSTTSALVSVTVNPRPSAAISYTTPVTFCQGGAVVLTAVSGTGVTYQWSENAVPLPSSTGNYYIASTSGSYSVTITNTLGCSSVSASILVVVNPLPLPVITRSNDILSTGSYDTYQWYFNSLPMTGVTGQSHQVLKNGGYSVRVTDVNGCTNYSDIFFYTSVGVSQVLSAAAVRVFPNPVQRMVAIAAAARVDVMLSDIAGRVLLNIENAKQIDMEQFPAGSYMLRITDEHGRYIKTEKLTKQTD
jgi:hypothetical protein